MQLKCALRHVVRRVLAALLAALAFTDTRAQTDPPRADLVELKVAYLFNFAQFAEWPAGNAAQGRFAFCALTQEGVGGSLAALEGRRLVDKIVTVVYPKTVADARLCRVLYVPSAREAIPSGWLRALADAPVLMVGEAGSEVVESLAMLFELRGDRLRWHIQLAPLRRSGVQLSSKLVEMAVTVRELAPKVLP